MTEKVQPAEVIAWHESRARRWDSDFRMGGTCVEAERHRSYAASVRELMEENERMAAALEPFATFADRWERNPLRGTDDAFYTIHAGEDEATLRLSDCKRARAALSGSAPKSEETQP